LFGSLRMQYDNLGQWVENLKSVGEVVELSGVHWNKAMGVVSQLARKRREGPALLFSGIPDYQPDFTVLVNSLGSTKRLALILRLGEISGYRDLVNKWKTKWKGLKLIPPLAVTNGPVLKNRCVGKDVDLHRFPAPHWHELDGGRYLGTGCVVIVKDPDTGWINLGTYRVQLQSKNEVTCYIGSTHHGSMIRQKYLQAGKRCPVAIVLGADPLLLLTASALGVPLQHSEYDYAGGIKGEPISVITGEMTGLPFPADAEAVLEGHWDFNSKFSEGPFGEFTGYYASGIREEARIEVQAAYFRDKPIFLGGPPTRPPNEGTFVNSILLSGSVEEELKGMGLPDLQGVWCHEAGAARMLTVVAIKQRYPGHAKQALVAASNTYTNIHNKIVIVVDDDVDITNLEEVMWAVCTRIDPEHDVEILRRCASTILDPAVPRGGTPRTSRLLIDATRPYERREQFARVISINEEIENKVRAEWGHLLNLR